jgi:hypothetical protein
MPNFTDEELEDLLFYQDNQTENFNSDYDSDDELGEDLIHEMNEIDMIQNLKFTEETKENFDQRNQRSVR